MDRRKFAGDAGAQQRHVPGGDDGQGDEGVRGADDAARPGIKARVADPAAADGAAGEHHAVAGEHHGAHQEGQHDVFARRLRIVGQIGQRAQQHIVKLRHGLAGLDDLLADLRQRRSIGQTLWILAQGIIGRVEHAGFDEKAAVLLLQHVFSGAEERGRGRKRGFLPVRTAGAGGKPALLAGKKRQHPVKVAVVDGAQHDAVDDFVFRHFGFAS